MRSELTYIKRKTRQSAEAIKITQKIDLYKEKVTRRSVVTFTLTSIQGSG